MAKPSIKDSQRELLLSHFTIENLQEAVFWVNSEGSILQVNDMACRLTGYSKEELLLMLK